MLHHRLGLLRARQGDLREAIGHAVSLVALRKDVAHAWLDLGRAYQLDGRWDEAVSMYRKALDLPGAESGTEEALAHALAQTLDFAGAAALYRTLLAREPRRADLERSLGEALLASGDLSGAADALSRAVALDPKAPGALGRLAEALERSGRPEEAAAACRKRIAQDGESAPALLQLGRALLDGNRLAEAVAALRAAMTLKPSDHLVHLLLSLAHGRLGESEGFRRVLLKALALAPFFEPILLDSEPRLPPEVLERRRRRWRAEERPRWEEARRLLGVQVDQSPGDVALRTALGEIYLRLSDTDGAALHFEKALGDDPGNPGALAGLALARIRQARASSPKRPELLEAAQSLLDRASAAVKEDPRTLHLSALVLHDQGRRSPARIALREAVRLAPGDVEARINLARAISGTGSVEALRVALALDELNVEAHSLISRWLPNATEAILHARRAVALAPDEPRAVNNLGNRLTVFGRDEEGLLLYEQSLRIEPADDRTRENVAWHTRVLGKLEEAERRFEGLAARGALDDFSKEQVSISLALGQPCRAVEALRRYLSAGMVGGERTNDATERLPDLLAEEKVFECRELETLFQDLGRMLKEEPAAPEPLLRPFLEIWSRSPSLAAAVDPAEIGRRLLALTGGRDPDALQLVARTLRAAGRLGEAVAALEESARLRGGGDALRGEILTWRKEALPDLPTFASVDAALDRGEVLLAAEDPWHSFPGLRDPSPGLEWTRPEFDDAGWRSGRGPFGFGKEEIPAPLQEIFGEEACLYLRGRFRLERPDRFRRVVLALRLEDGAVVWLNGSEVGRLRAGKAGEAFAHDAHATEIAPKPLAEETIELPATRLLAGENQLAVQVLKFLPKNGDLYAELEVRGERSAAEDREKLAAFRATASGATAAARLEHVEGRLLAREGKRAEAAAAFERAAAGAPGAVEPILHLRESLREAYGRRDGDARLRAWLASHPPPGSLASLPPEPPEPVGPDRDQVLTAPAATLEVAPFFLFDPQGEHTGTQWELWPAVAGSGRALYQYTSKQAATRLELPPGLLEPNRAYRWHAKFAALPLRSEFSREGQFRTGDFAFHAVPFDLSAVFNGDVVANPGDPADDPFDVLSACLTVDGFDGRSASNRAIRGLPPDGRLGIHRLGDYSRPNALQLSPAQRGPVRIPAPRGRYRALRFLFAGGGESDVPARLTFASGQDLVVVLPCPDWTNAGAGLGKLDTHWLVAAEGLEPLLARDQPDRSFSDGFRRNLFELLAPLPEDRELVSIELLPDPDGFSNPPKRFNLLAITGVARD